MFCSPSTSVSSRGTAAQIGESSGGLYMMKLFFQGYWTATTVGTRTEYATESASSHHPCTVLFLHLVHTAVVPPRAAFCSRELSSGTKANMEDTPEIQPNCRRSISCLAPMTSAFFCCKRTPPPRAPPRRTCRTGSVTLCTSASCPP